jgi:predicted nucleic acid-binding Zn ribbon protein
MDWITILTVAGVVCTVGFGLAGIYYFYRARRYPGEITFIKESCIGLFDTIVRNLDELSVQYKGEPIGENLVLLKGYIVNTGSIDISQEMVADKIRIRLPDGFRWMTAKKVSSSDGVKAKINIIDACNIELETGLFRRKEFVQFEAIAEVPIKQKDGEGDRIDPSSDFMSKLQFVHRIANTQKVVEKELPREISNKRKKKIVKIIWIPIVYLLVSSCLLLWLEWDKSNRFMVGYLLTTKEGKQIEVTAKITADDMVELHGIIEDYENKISITEFVNSGKCKQIMVKRPFDYSTIYMLLAMFAVMGIMLYIVLIYPQRKASSLRKLISTGLHGSQKNIGGSKSRK